MKPKIITPAELPQYLCARLTLYCACEAGDVAPAACDADTVEDMYRVLRIFFELGQAVGEMVEMLLRILPLVDAKRVEGLGS